MIDRLADLVSRIFDWALEVVLTILSSVWQFLLQFAREHPSSVVLLVLAFVRMLGTTVQSGTAAVLFTFGRAKKVLQPGFHPLIPLVQTVRHTPVRSVTLDLPRQRVTTCDGLVYDVDTTIVYRVEDAITAVIAIDNIRHGVMTLLPLLVHELIREQTRETLSARKLLDQELTERARQALTRWGLYVETAGLSTIAPTRPTVRLSQLSARVTERVRLWHESGGTGVALVFTTAAQAPQGKPRARYRRQRVTDLADLASAKISVILPRGGQLTVNDEIMIASDSRTFETPRLERDKPYYYTMKVDYIALGLPISESRLVEIRAGRSYVVDFTQPIPDPTEPGSFQTALSPEP